MALHNSDPGGGMPVDDDDGPWEILPAEDVPEFEARLLQDPGDRRVRAQLLRFAHLAQARDPSQRQRHREHCLWFIEHDPAGKVHGGHTTIFQLMDPSGYAQGERLWLAHLQRDPENLAILRNAAGYFTVTDYARAKSLLERAERIDPENADWPLAIGRLCELRARRRVGAPDPELTGESHRVYQRALAKAQEPCLRYMILCNAAPAALRAGDTAAARSYALDLLDRARTPPEPGFDGDAIYTGHAVLGLLALRSGDADEAARELLEAGQTRGSPVLNSFGPDFSLADALLQRGSTEAVLSFLELCKRFWSKPQLLRWVESIRAGERPRLDRFDHGDEGPTARAVAT